MSYITKWINRLFPTFGWKVFGITLAGVFFGGVCLFLYLLRAHVYLGSDPKACMNCHVMTPFYATWEHGAHARYATCNDCHIPQDNFFRKWLFKAKDGSNHVRVFLTNAQPQVIQAHDAGSTVIMENCIRCHQEMNTAFVSTGKIDYMMAQAGAGKACWDCHKDVGHGGQNAQLSTPHARVPYPDSPVPQWLQKMIKGKKENK